MKKTLYIAILSIGLIFLPQAYAEVYPEHQDDYYKKSTHVEKDSKDTQNEVLPTETHSATVDEIPSGKDEKVKLKESTRPKDESARDIILDQL